MKNKVLFLVFLSISATAQNQIQEDKSSVYFQVIAGMPTGKYNTMLKNTKTDASNIGVSAGYLLSHYRGKKPSKLFYGLEFTYQSHGTDAIPAYISGTYDAVFSSVTFNALARYRPIWWSSKINPFFDTFFGPKVMGQRIVEYVDQNTTAKVWALPRTALNYGFGIGSGFKLNMPTGKSLYIDLGIYYQQTDPKKLIKRKSISIDSNGDVKYEQMMLQANQWQIRVGLTGFQ